MVAPEWSEAADWGPWVAVVSEAQCLYSEDSTAVWGSSWHNTQWAFFLLTHIWAHTDQYTASFYYNNLDCYVANNKCRKHEKPMSMEIKCWGCTAWQIFVPGLEPGSLDPKSRILPIRLNDAPRLFGSTIELCRKKSLVSLYCTLDCKNIHLLSFE